MKGKRTQESKISTTLDFGKSK